MVSDHLQALLDVVEGESARLESARSDLARAKEALAHLSRARWTNHDGDVIVPLSDDITAATVARLIREEKGVMRDYVMVPDEGPAYDDETRRESKARLRAGHGLRSIYPMQALTSRRSVEQLEMWASLGEEQRFLPATKTEFAVFGESAVVAYARWGDESSGYVLIREPVVVAAFAGFFDLQWAAAMPLADDPSSTEERLVDLLSLGLKDEAIARQLGIGLRTVRRHVAHLMATHGVDTRFQLGMKMAQAKASQPSLATRRHTGAGRETWRPGTFRSVTGAKQGSPPGGSR